MKRYSDSVADNTLLVSQNVTNLMNDIRAEDLLNDAVYYIDARNASASGQTIDNLGTAKELLPTTLGSSTSADSNDPQYLSWSGTNYVYLPGSSGNYLSVPDSNALDITGDIDIRVKVAFDDWTPAAASNLIDKWGFTTNLSYILFLNVSGILTLSWTTGGTGATQQTANSTVAAGIADGATKWVRATLDVDNGAGTPQYEVKFFLSDDGTAWTQLGSTVTGTTGVTSVYAGTAQLALGASNGGGASTVQGKIFHAQVLNGIDGTKVLDVDTSVLKTGAETSFTALTGQTVTINRSTSGRKTVAVTQPCWLFGTDDYMEVNNRYMSSGTYLYLPGISASANNATSPDSAALDITGDIDIRAKVAMDSWTDTGFPSFINKNGTASAQRSYGLGINSGTLYLAWSPDGTSTNEIRKDATTTIGLSAGTTKWVRATLDVDNGASGNTVTFYTSDDGTNWTQLGNTVTTVGVTSIFSGTGTITICGNLSTTNQFRGKVFRAQIFNGIDGTKVFDADFENKITSLEQTSFVEASSNAATVTINRSGSTYKSAGITKSGYLYPGSINKFKESSISLLDFAKNEPFSIVYACRAFSGTGTGTVVAKSDTYGGTLGYISIFAASNFMYQNTFQNWPTYFYYYSEPIVLNGNLAVNTIVREPFGTGNTGMGSTSSVINYSNGGSGSYSTTPGNSVGDVNETITNNYTFKLGTSNNMANLFDGEIYAVAIFRRALTQQETNIIYNYFNRRSL